MASRLARYQVVIFGCLFVGYAFYILCRKSFGFVIPICVETEGLTKEDIGKVASAGHLAYAISKFIIGVLSDQISARVLFFLGLTLSGASVVGFGRASSVPMYTLLWFVNGLAQGCGWPACAKMLRQWFKPSQFGTVWSLLSASVNVTGAIVPLILPYLLLVGNGWRGFMVISGVVSIASAVAALTVVRDSPKDYGLPEIAIDSKKKDDKKPPTAKSTGKWSALLRSGFLWRLSFYYFVVFAAKTSIENWAQLLVLEEKKLSPALAGGVASSFELGGMLSSFATGYITDWVLARQPQTPKAANPRMKVAMGYMLVSVIALWLFASSYAFLPLLSFILGASLYGNINIFGIVATEEAPVHLSGSSHAVVSILANVGAVLAGYPLSILATTTSLAFGFYLQSLLCLICLVALLLTKSSSTKIAHID